MPDALTRLFSLYPARARPLARPMPLGNAGGFSGASLWRFDSGLGPLVARRWPEEGPAPEALRRIHDWLARLGDLDFIPVPIPCLDGRTLVEIEGRWWEVGRWLDGTADLARPPAPARLRVAFAALAAVHQRLAFESVRAPCTGLAARASEADRLLASELAELESLARLDPGDPVAAMASRWIALARRALPALAARLRREASRTAIVQPVLRDARAEHFLFDGDRLVGLVDFGAMALDSPAADLARLMSEWIGPDRAAGAEALDAYAAVRPLDPIESSLIDVYAESAAWLGPARWIRWHLVEHRRFDDPDAARIGLDRALGRLLERLVGSALADHLP